MKPRFDGNNLFFCPISVTDIWFLYRVFKQRLFFKVQKLKDVGLQEALTQSEESFVTRLLK